MVLFCLQLCYQGTKFGYIGNWGQWKWWKSSEDYFSHTSKDRTCEKQGMPGDFMDCISIISLALGRELFSTHYCRWSLRNC